VCSIFYREICLINPEIYVLGVFLNVSDIIMILCLIGHCRQLEKKMASL
jgi:hypothetical protein